MNFQLLLICCFIGSSLFAQRMISGQVMNENNEPLIGTWVSHQQFPKNDEVVFVEMDGSYSLEVGKDCQMLYVSYEWTLEVPLGDLDTANVIFVYGFAGRLKRKQPTSSRQFAIHASGKVEVGKMAKTATVQIKGTDRMTQVDEEGHFSLLVPPGHDVLVFSAENHIKTEIRLGEVRTVYVPIRLYPQKKRRWWQIFRRKN